MEDNAKNRRWLKDTQNWHYRSPSVIQLRSPDTDEFIDWFQIRASKASPVAAADIGDGLFYIGGSATQGQLIGYCSGRQIGPVSAWDEAQF